MRIAIMQPYFMPYAGYFRLMEGVDHFVFYDCVQFPRRGWVHRNQLTHSNGTKEWLTLPLLKTDRDSTRIMDLQFAPNAQGEWHKRLSEFPVLAKTGRLPEQVATLNGSPCDFIIEGLRTVCSMLGIHRTFSRSSDLSIPEHLKGQDRILAIAERLRATTYINAPGGRDLYDTSTFAKRGIELVFLPDYKGPMLSMLERLLSEDASAIAHEIRANMA